MEYFLSSHPDNFDPKRPIILEFCLNSLAVWARSWCCLKIENSIGNVNYNKFNRSCYGRRCRASFYFIVKYFFVPLWTHLPAHNVNLFSASIYKFRSILNFWQMTSLHHFKKRQYKLVVNSWIESNPIMCFSISFFVLRWHHKNVWLKLYFCRNIMLNFSDQFRKLFFSYKYPTYSQECLETH